MSQNPDQLAFDWDFPVPVRGVLSFRQVATLLGRAWGPTAAHPSGKVDHDHVLALVEEGELVAIEDSAPGATKVHRMILASSLRLYIARQVTTTPPDYLQRLQFCASNLPPPELRALAEWALKKAAQLDEKSDAIRAAAKPARRAA